MKHIAFLAAALAAATLAAPACAALLAGQTVQIGHEYPTLGTFDLGPVDYTVGTSGPVYYESAADISVTDTQFTINVHCGEECSWSSASFNGFGLFDTYGTVKAFTSVTIDGATSYAGFDVSRISFDGNSIRVNLADLDANGLIVLNIAAVPEPASWALMIGGFAMVGVAMRRRKALLAA